MDNEETIMSREIASRGRKARNLFRFRGKWRERAN